MWRTATKPTYDDPRGSFRGWLLTQTYRIDGVGKIARRVADDSCLGQRLSAESVRQHTLTCHSAAPAVIEGFNQAIEEWQQGKASVPGSQPDSVIRRPSSRIPVSAASWSGHTHSWAERGRSLVGVLGQCSEDILRRSVSISRRASRAGVVRRTPALLADLLWTNRERRTRARDRRSEIGNSNRHARTTRPTTRPTRAPGPKGGNEPTSASDRWYERVAAGK
jgi:hypothetical protein